MMAIRDKKVRAEVETEIAERLSLSVGELRQGIAPLVERHVYSAYQEHRAALLEAHKDFDAVAPEVEKWIAKQPGYLKSAFQQVFDEGATQDVIDLFTRFKKETGHAAPQESQQPPARSSAPTDPTTEKDARALEHVETRRVAPKPTATGGPDKDDFDAGFEEALAQWKAGS